LFQLIQITSYNKDCFDCWCSNGWHLFQRKHLQRPSCCSKFCLSWQSVSYHLLQSTKASRRQAGSCLPACCAASWSWSKRLMLLLCWWSLPIISMSESLRILEAWGGTHARDESDAYLLAHLPPKIRPRCPSSILVPTDK
jgi:hypothetical protein